MNLNWDYDLHKSWKPRTDEEWQWFLVRRINYAQFKGLSKKVIKKYFPKIKDHLDPGKRAMIEYFIKK